MAAPTRAPPGATSGRPSVVRRYRPVPASHVKATWEAGHAVDTEAAGDPPGPGGPNRNPGSPLVALVPARTSRAWVLPMTL